MTRQYGENVKLQLLDTIPVVPAPEYFDTDTQEEKTVASPQPDDKPAFDNKRAFKLCKCVMQNPFQPSSQYPRLIGMSPKVVLKLRRQLVEKGLLRERTLDSCGRGRSTIVLEVTNEGRAAVAASELGRR